MILRLFYILLSTVFAGGVSYAACVIWPLNLPPTTGMVAAISVGLGWAMVAGVFADSSKSEDKT